MSIRAPIFSNQSMLGAIFVQIFREFQKVLKDFPGFQRILPGFYQIKTFAAYTSVFFFAAYTNVFFSISIRCVCSCSGRKKQHLKNSCCRIFFDNFCTSPQLVCMLMKERKIYSCGTARQHRRRLPKDMKSTKKSGKG